MFPGLGSNWSCSCWPMPQPEQCGIQAASATYTIAHGNQILNPLREARDGICILIDTCQIHFHCAMTGIPRTPVFFSPASFYSTSSISSPSSKFQPYGIMISIIYCAVYHFSEKHSFFLLLGLSLPFYQLG